MSVLTYYAPTPAGRAALERAVVEAKKLNSNVQVFNVPPASVASADIELTRLLADAEKVGVSVSTVPVGEASKPPVEQLVSATDTPSVELVVIGLPRRTAVGKLLMGSVEQQILLRSEAAVLSVKAPH